MRKRLLNILLLCCMVLTLLPLPPVMWRSTKQTSRIKTSGSMSRIILIQARMAPFLRMRVLRRRTSHLLYK